MRTTVNLEPEALAKVRLLARQRRVSLGKIVSDLILKATQPGISEETKNGVPIFPPRAGTSPDADLVNSLRE